MSQLICRPTGGAGDHVARKPKITAIVAVANEEAHLRECLHGLMEQTIAESLEVIVIDHASTESEWAIVADLQRRYDNITAIRTPEPGVGAALTLGAKVASGKYLVVLEAADRLRKDALEVLAGALDSDHEAMAAYGDTCFTTIPHETFERHTSSGKMIWPDYTVQQLSQPSPVAPHPMWRREAHDSVGWFNDEEGAPLRTFLLQVARRFRMLHLEAFLGLKLTPAAHGAALDIPRRTEATPSAQTETPSAPQLGADEAYALIQRALADGDEEGALQWLREMLALHPHHAAAHNDLAALTYRMGEVAQAIGHYEAAVRLAPQESVYRKNLADIYFVEAGRTDEAIGIYLQLLQEDPRDVETLLNLGIISEAMAHPEEAEKFYQRGLEIEPWNAALREQVTALRSGGGTAHQESAEERYAAVQELVAQGSLAEAAVQLEELVQVFPGCALAHNDLAVLSYQGGEKEKALAHYEKAAQLEPDNSTFQKNLADFYFVEGEDTDKGIAIYLEEHRKDPRNVETLMSLGKICEMLDRGAEARSFYDRVLQLEPWNREARESLKEVA